MNSQPLAPKPVINEARFPELPHEKANARPRGAYHFCQRPMTHLQNRAFAGFLYIQVGEQQENPRQSLLTFTTMLLDQVLLVSNVSCQHICPKHICQLHMPCQGKQHDLLLNSQKSAVCNCAGRGRAEGLTCYGVFANKIILAEYVENCFFLMGFGAEFYGSRLYDKYRISHVTLSVDCLSLPIGHQLPTIAHSGEKGLGVESASLFGHRVPVPLVGRFPHLSKQTMRKMVSIAQQCLRSPPISAPFAEFPKKIAALKKAHTVRPEGVP
jgi:hypothetical protein